MFQFRLETLLAVRDQVRNERQAELAKAYEAEHVVDAKRGKISGEIESLTTARREVMQRSAIDVEQLIQLRHREVFLHAQYVEATQQLELIREEIEVQRRAVLEADKDVKVMEKLKERQRQRYDDELFRQETKTIDEMTQRTQHITLSQSANPL